jgi:hypothetical protein
MSSLTFPASSLPTLSCVLTCKSETAVGPILVMANVRSEQDPWCEVLVPVPHASVSCQQG